MTYRNDLQTGSKPAPGELALIQGFVNTINLETNEDIFATPKAAQTWLEHHGLLERSGSISEEDRQGIIAFREAVRALLLRNNGQPLDPVALTTLQHATANSPLRLSFAQNGVAELASNKKGIDGALGKLQAVIYKAMVQGNWSRLKACLGDACQWAFYDASKNRSGTWCTMEVCGNRTKVRAHRKRKAQSVEL